jgi:SpoVK/Ycf46/Vps4 family AAA+-type ATPase
VDLLELARRTEGLTGAQLEQLLREAAMIALREFLARRSEEGTVLEVEARHVAQAQTVLRGGNR